MNDDHLSSPDKYQVSVMDYTNYCCDAYRISVNNETQATTVTEKQLLGNHDVIVNDFPYDFRIGISREKIGASRPFNPKNKKYSLKRTIKRKMFAYKNILFCFSYISTKHPLNDAPVTSCEIEIEINKGALKTSSPTSKDYWVHYLIINYIRFMEKLGRRCDDKTRFLVQ